MLISENFGEILEPGLRKVFVDQFKQMTSQIPVLFNVQDSDKAVEHDLEMGDISDFEQFTGTVSYTDTKQGWKTNYEHQEYVKGIKIQRKLVEDDQYNVIKRQPQMLGTAAFRRRESDAASVFNNAFNSSVVGGDGVSLCNSAHLNIDSTVSQSNAGTTALSPTSVEATRRLMVKFRTNAGNPFQVDPDLLIVPLELEQTAYEIVNSKGKVDTAQNNVNFHQGKYKVVVWKNWLTSSTRWWMTDSVMMKMYLNWFDRVATQFVKDSDFETFVAKYAGYMRYSYGWSDWRFVYGHNA